MQSHKKSIKMFRSYASKNMQIATILSTSWNNSLQQASIWMHSHGNSMLTTSLTSALQNATKGFNVLCFIQTTCMSQNYLVGPSESI